MPRLPRPVADGLVYHALIRGNNRGVVFAEQGAVAGAARRVVTAVRPFSCNSSADERRWCPGIVANRQTARFFCGRTRRRKVVAPAATPCVVIACGGLATLPGHHRQYAASLGAVTTPASQD